MLSTMYLQVTAYHYDTTVDEFYYDTTKSRSITRIHRILQSRFAAQFHIRRKDGPVGDNGVFVCQSISFDCNAGDVPRDDFGILSKPYDPSVAPSGVDIVDVQSHELLFDTVVEQSDDVPQRIYEPVDVKGSEWTSAREP